MGKVPLIVTYGYNSLLVRVYNLKAFPQSGIFQTWICSIITVTGSKSYVMLSDADCLPAGRFVITAVYGSIKLIDIPYLVFRKQISIT